MFGTDGVRGVAGDELTVSLALNLSVAAAALQNCRRLMRWLIAIDAPYF